MAKLKYNFRGIVGKSLKEKDIKRFAKMLASYIYINKLIPQIVIGKDNRVSGDYVSSVVKTELLKSGINVYSVGTITTPGLAYITKRFAISVGLMITASHNSCECNGLKWFDKNGYSINFEDYKNVSIKKSYTKIIDGKNFKDLYIKSLKQKLTNKSVNYIFDCANGASTEIVREVFKGCKIIGTEISGKYINNGFGTENIDTLRTYCKRNKKIGFAFDGDADRVVAVDCDGEVIDGDKILYILASQKLGAGDKVVGTSISSLGLEVALNKLGIQLIRTIVGARYVASKMKELGVKLGSEPCGHVFNELEYSDGVSVAIELINILNRTGLTFKQLLKDYADSYRFCKDVELGFCENIEDYDVYENDTHVVIRKSLTENKFRIFVESFDKTKAEQKFNEIVNSLEN
ncbi:MAG: hypothetical protein IJA72_04970 [Clostridia bacterium]|nr:hypothetical protein [Clostridia bacterium]